MKVAGCGQNRVDVQDAYRLITPADGPDITASEYQDARHIADIIRAFVQSRDTEIASGNIDPGLAKSSESWINPDDRVCYGTLIPQKAILQPDFAFVNRLRHHCNLFTGYSLPSILTGERVWSWTDDIGGSIPEEFMCHAPDWSVGAFLEITQSLPTELVCHPPTKLGETGWLVNGGVVNRDVMAYQERIALLNACGILDELKQRGNARILEIGGGYGGLAYFLKRLLPNAQYFICDLPFSLFFSATYLTLAGGYNENLFYTFQEQERLLQERRGFTFVPNLLFEDLHSIPFDLAINTMSFAEMAAETVEAYARGIAQMVGTRGFLFEQNFDNSHYNKPNFCEPKAIISRHFRHKLDIGPGARWGVPNLWMNDRNAFTRSQSGPAAHKTEAASAPAAHPVKNGGSDTAEAQGTLPQSSSQPERVLYMVDAAELNRIDYVALEGYDVSVLALGERNVLKYPHACIDVVSPDAEIMQGLGDRKFDTVILPYGDGLYNRGIALVPMALRFSQRIRVLFPDGRTRLYEGEGAHRLQYNSAYLNTLFQFVPPIRDQEVLEVGCSDGLVCDLVLSRGPRKILGIDLMDSVGCNFPNPKIEYHKMDAMRLQFDPGQFDLCYSIATMEHVNDPYTVIQEMKRVTRSGGYIYVQAGPLYHSPFGHHMFGLFDDIPWIHLRKTPEEIVEISRRSGAADRLKSTRGLEIDHYVRSMLNSMHINGKLYSEYRLEEIMNAPNIEMLFFSRSYEGRELLTSAIQAELRQYDAEDLVAHGFEMIFRVR